MRSGLLILAGSLGLVASTGSQYRTLDRGPLIGLKEVSVIVEEIGPDYARLGVSVDRLHTMTELSLRQARVQIGPAPQTPSFVYVAVNALPILLQDGSVIAHAANVSVEVHAIALLVHSSTTETVTIWAERMLVYADEQHFQAHVESAVNELIDKFANDYLAANPPKR